jgi:hypothetical protein
MHDPVTRTGDRVLHGRCSRAAWAVGTEAGNASGRALVGPA